MIYLVYNEYYNRGNKTIEIRNEYLECITIKLDDDIYSIGDFVFVEKINGKQKISQKVDKPSNFLKFYLHNDIDQEELKNEIITFINKIKSDNIRTILEETILKNDDFFLFPAAKTIHHAYIGGLATHTINILKLAQFYGQMYDLNTDQLYAGAMLHDFGKIYELTDYGLNYSITGNLLGHINICYEIVANIAIELDINDSLEIIELKHMILSHHGKMEYGSPKEPMTLESYVLAQLDDVDAKIDLLKNTLEDSTINKLTPPIMAMDRRRFIKLWEE